MTLTSRRLVRRGALAAVVAGAVAWLSASLLFDEAVSDRATMTFHSPTDHVDDPAPVSSSSSPPRDLAEPPARALAYARPPDLAPLAARWRAAVVNQTRAELPRAGLALRRTPEGRAALCLLARDDPDARVRAFAVRELGQARDPALRDLFTSALSDPSPVIRENARWALEQLGP